MSAVAMLTGQLKIAKLLHVVSLINVGVARFQGSCRGMFGKGVSLCCKCDSHWEGHAVRLGRAVPPPPHDIKMGNAHLW